jgi:sigma-B regulation protein RsbU (phosphoserine phosphatase)
MDFEDISRNQRIAGLWNLTRQLRKTTSPSESMRVIRKALSEAYGPSASVLLATRGLPAGDFKIVELNLDPNSEGPSDFAAGETVHRGGIAGEIISVDEPRLVQNVDWKNDPAFAGILDQFTSVAAIPLLSQRLIMTWVLLLKRPPVKFDLNDLQELVLRTALIGSLLESQALVGDLANANARIDREMRQTGELQRMLLPDPLPRIPGLEMAVSYETSGRAGGDLYDVFRLDDRGEEQHRWCVLIADASGHGLVAAVVMAIVQSILRAHPDVIAGPADLQTHINSHLCRKKIGGFVTAFLAIYTPTTFRLTYASAGHPAPLKRTAAGVASLDGSANLPLGIEPTTVFDEACTTLVEGDTLLLYTDGITDARNRQGELFDTPRLQKELANSGDLPRQIITHLQRQVLEHQQGTPLADDQTMLAIRVMG